MDVASKANQTMAKIAERLAILAQARNAAPVILGLLHRNGDVPARSPSTAVALSRENGDGRQSCGAPGIPVVLWPLGRCRVGLFGVLGEAHRAQKSWSRSGERELADGYAGAREQLRLSQPQMATGK